jgi:hypothetical protein
MAPQSRQRIESKEVALTGIGAWVSLLIYCAFSFGLFYVGVTTRQFAFITITGFFALFGVVGLVMMVVKSLGQAKFGDVRLVLEGPPAAVGGTLRASLRLPDSAAGAKTVKTVLTCILVTDAGKGQTRETPRWARRAVFPVRPGSALKIEIAIPADQPPSGRGIPDDTGLMGYAKWELKAEAEVDGLDFARSFDVEVKVAAPAPGAAPASREGPIEIVRPSALGAALPFTPAFKPSPATPSSVKPSAVTQPAVAISTEPAAAAPLLLPEDDRKSLWVLVAINLLPVAGVAFWGWRVHEIVFLYWIENLVIGAVNVLRMRIAVPDNLSSLAKRGVAPTDGEMFMGKAVLIGFFIVHYGAFCYGHGTFLAGFFPAGPGAGRELGGVLRSMLLQPSTLVAITGIVLSHAYSYFHNYIGRGEYLRADLGKMMFRPYKRIVVTHLFIFAGAFAMAGLGSPVAAMVAFIGIKIAIDAYSHRQERKQLAASG